MLGNAVRASISDLAGLRIVDLSESRRESDWKATGHVKHTRAQLAGRHRECLGGLVPVLGENLPEVATPSDRERDLAKLWSSVIGKSGRKIVEWSDSSLAGEKHQRDVLGVAVGRTGNVVEREEVGQCTSAVRSVGALLVDDPDQVRQSLTFTAAIPSPPERLRS